MSESKKILLTSQKIANLYPRAKLEERKLTSILQRAGVPNTRGTGGGYEVFPATDAILTYYKEGYLQRDVAGESDRARKNKSEADSAELDALEKAGKTCLLSDAKLFWSDARIEIRQTIERADFLTEAQKKRLLAKLATLRIEAGA